MDWIDTFRRDIFEAADEHHVDLDRLEWLPAERGADVATVRLALRRGRASRLGIIVDAVDVDVAAYPERVGSTHAEAVAFRPTLRSTLEKLEGVVPGTLAAEDASNLAVDQSIADTLARADAELAADLAAEPVPELVTHWRQLGGTVPEPL